MKIYQISGLGANGRAFKNLRLEEGFEQVYIPWLAPEKNETLPHYTERLMQGIDISEDFILMGLSFGGMIVQEMNRFINPRHTFLISTVKNRAELPNYLKLSSTLGIHNFIPMSFFSSDRGLSYMMLRKLYYTDRSKSNIDDIFEFRDKKYLKWSINEIVNWSNNHIDLKMNQTHIHGNKDIVFPIKYIKNSINIEDGTHIMILQKAKQVSKEINNVLIQL